ncbi:hypothetical protein HZF08_02655 [Paenibacillus sp. CGMCC 1.16610]|uniref:Uncharacterized protein n=1 Tax=Paenibacillus anseongense TaxID=2682845 RepID=A0ABW9UBY2_9BACL|nr:MULTISPECIES: hypothetical protein [Paenibacillus]MBA2937192.1 hypothetical protein [Paenibacillus sp. CGMCC 1.16610]MVQ36253.1 hypothetical protein [Paenibacillus anseongense]
MDKDFMWGIFVSEDIKRFPNFFPIGFYASRELAVEEIQGLPKDVNYDLLKLPLNRNFAYFHKKSCKFVGMDGIYHEHYHFKREHESD